MPFRDAAFGRWEPFFGKCHPASSQAMEWILQKMPTFRQAPVCQVVGCDAASDGIATHE